MSQTQEDGGMMQEPPSCLISGNGTTVFPAIPVNFWLCFKPAKHQGMLVFLPWISIPFCPPSSWSLSTHTCISSSPDSCVIPNLAPRAQPNSFTSLVIHLTSLCSFLPCLPHFFSPGLALNNSPFYLLDFVISRDGGRKTE